MPPPPMPRAPPAEAKVPRPDVLPAEGIGLAPPRWAAERLAVPLCVEARLAVFVRWEPPRLLAVRFPALWEGRLFAAVLPLPGPLPFPGRSEERRVGEEGRSRRSPSH